MLKRSMIVICVASVVPRVELEVEVWGRGGGQARVRGVEGWRRGLLLG